MCFGASINYIFYIPNLTQSEVTFCDPIHFLWDGSEGCYHVHDILFLRQNLQIFRVFTDHSFLLIH